MLVIVIPLGRIVLDSGDPGATPYAEHIGSAANKHLMPCIPCKCWNLGTKRGKIKPRGKQGEGTYFTSDALEKVGETTDF